MLAQFLPWPGQILLTPSENPLLWYLLVRGGIGETLVKLGFAGLILLENLELFEKSDLRSLKPNPSYSDNLTAELQARVF